MPVEIRTRTAQAARGAPGEIDTLFVLSSDAGLGATAKSIRSIGDYTTLGATRAANPMAYDGIDNFFREGGKRAVVAKKGVGASALTDALALFVEDFGGGQVVAWADPVVPADQQALVTWAKSTKRFALLDVSSTDNTVAKLVTAGGAAPANDQDYCLLAGPWLAIPAPAGIVGGTARQVPASSSVAALIARADGYGNPNRAAAGRDFALQYATGITGPVMSDTDTASLRTAGLNPFRSKFGNLVLDGFQTPIDTDPDNPFWQANCSRARMWLQWNATAVGLNYEYKPIDGRGRLAKGLQTDLEVICGRLWEADGLYGDTPQEAYAVEVGTAINTASTIAYGELHAVVEARFSLHARTVIIELVSVPITGAVSA
jgi:hypothetical protein